MICKECGEYMEYTGEGIDDEERLYDLYICIECGYEEAVPQDKLENVSPPAKFEWDPPDGYRKP
jgi:DNA-directed RNA polymerase subunit M/transcription elongation factor TFIIS